MKKKNKKEKSILLRLMLLGVCVYMLTTLAGLWNSLNKSRADLKALQERCAAEQNNIDELRALLADGSQAEIIEKAARERLGYVYPEEQIFIDISGS